MDQEFETIGWRRLWNPRCEVVDRDPFQLFMDDVLGR